MQPGNLVEGKVVIVTGSGRGIGAAIAKLMARHGGKVVVNDIGVSADGQGADATPAQEVVNEIKQAGGEATANYDSVSEFKSAARIVQCALDNFGRVDCVVNNAAILRDVIFHKMTEDDWDSVMNVMLKGAFNMCRHAAKHFCQQSSGSFVHITSTSGLIGGSNQVSYCAAKLGMVALSKAIAVDMAPFNVRSNCIAPSAWTRLAASVQVTDPAIQKRIEKRKLVTPEHNAPLAVFLASDAAVGVNAQVFATRKNEIFLMSQSRPLRGIHRSEGWTPDACAEHMYPALKSWFYPPTDLTGDVFPWDSI